MTSPRTELPPSRYPGERLGLPESGRNSVGRIGRRILALFIDGIIADLIAVVFFHYNQWAILATFTALQVLGIWALGASIGHRMAGLRLTALPGSKPYWWRPVVRSLLLAVVVPTLVWDSDQRGFHDKVAGTVLIRW